MIDPSMPDPADLHPDTDPNESDLAGVPRVFVHGACGGATQLEAPTVRRVLRDPFRLIGAGSQVWCAGCRKTAVAADCHWQETGENVRAYYRRLIGRAYLAAPWGWVGRFLLLYLGVGGLGTAAVAAVLAVKTGDAATARVLAAVAGGVVAAAVLVALVTRVAVYRRCAAEYRAAEES